MEKKTDSNTNTIAADILEIAAAAPDSARRYGGRTVYVTYIADKLGWPLVTVKQALLTAHRAGLLELVRADLVERHELETLAASEIDDRFSFYHAVVDRSYVEPWDRP